MNNLHPLSIPSHLLRAAIKEPKTLQALLDQRDVICDLLHGSSESTLVAISKLPAVALSRLLSYLYQEMTGNDSEIMHHSGVKLSKNRTAYAGKNQTPVLKFVTRVMEFRYPKDWDSCILYQSNFDCNEEWIVCLIFMIAYDAFFTQDPQKCFRKNPTHGSSSVESTLGDDTAQDTCGRKRQDNVIPSHSSRENHDIIEMALELLDKIRKVAVQMKKLKDLLYENETANIVLELGSHQVVKSILDDCFPTQIETMNQFSSKQASSKLHSEPTQTEENTNDLSDKDSLESSQSSPVAPKRKRLKKMDSFFHSNSPSKTDKKMDPDVIEIRDDCSDNRSEKSGSDVSNSSIKSTSLGKPTNSKHLPKEIYIDSPDFIPSKLEESALKLRTLLLSKKVGQLSPEEIRNISDQTADVLRKSCSKDLGGAKGIEMIGNLIAFGKVQSISPHLKIEKDDCDENTSKLAFTDTIISNVTKSFLNEAFSTPRISAFMKSCVLPLCFEMDATDDSKVNSSKHIKIRRNQSASRVLVATILSLAKRYPKECVQSILLPLLSMQKYCKNSNDNDTARTNAAQCEMISRVIKQNLLPKECLSLLIEGMSKKQKQSTLSTAVTDDNTKNVPMYLMNDHSLSVLISAMQQKPKLSNEVTRNVIRGIVEVCQGSSDNNKEYMSMLNNVKFTSMFQLFATQYGSQIKESGSIESLLHASETMTTFSSKSIVSTLTKLMR